jgi:FKBP-type peptidyl-prolyl cis-trans isomerase FklB
VKSHIIAAVVSCALLHNVAAQELKLDTPAKGFSYSLGVQTGNNIRTQLPQALKDIDLGAMMMGIRDRLEGRENRLDVAEMAFWSGKFLKTLEDREKAKAGDNLIAGEQFREQYKARAGVQATSSGVLYTEIKPGAGRQPGIGQTVSVHYVGKLISGSEFGNSRSENEGPQELKVRELRAGLQEAITLMQGGAVWEVVIPPELAYGKEGVGTIGPNETLIYEIELLEIK